ncbi:class I SAM-dependent methyltransferase [Paraburkholderia sediminicola]|uniref:Class I SAM-dependent methyltransferase n=1 Tax=Paraburkholderia rhynchosiae TaxID=487049 RepID=A0ACC7N4T1_9BURK
MRSDLKQLRDFYPSPAAKPEELLQRLGWPNAPDLAARYAALLSPIDFTRYSPHHRLRLLDVGCGFGLLLDYLKENALLDLIDYTGVDLVDAVLTEARSRWPNARFEKRDVRDLPYPDDAFDYCIVCGIFTVKVGNTYAETVALAQSTLKALWPSVTLGLGFNSMSKHVDWEREDLFHWPLDDIMAFSKRDLSRHVSFRLDYGLWEVSTLIGKTPRIVAQRVPTAWGEPTSA